jgi:hypothetical protein
MKTCCLFLLSALIGVSSLQAQDSTQVTTKTKNKGCCDGDSAKFTIHLGPSGKVDKYEIRWVMFDFGLNTYLYDNQFNLPSTLRNYELDYGRSLHYNLRLFEQRLAFGKNRKIGVFQGINFEWQQFAFSGDGVLQADQPTVTFASSDIRYSKNRLSTFVINAPIGLHFESNPDDLSKSFHLGAGVFGGFLYGANVKTKIEDSRDKNKVRDDYNLNKFRYGWTARLGYGPINFYASYTVTPLFKNGEGPELTPLQIGVTLIPF